MSAKESHGRHLNSGRGVQQIYRSTSSKCTVACEVKGIRILSCAIELGLDCVVVYILESCPAVQLDVLDEPDHVIHELASDNFVHMLVLLFNGISVIRPYHVYRSQEVLRPQDILYHSISLSSLVGYVLRLQGMFCNGTTRSSCTS